MELMIAAVVDAIVDTVTSVLTTNVPVIATVFGALVALGIALHFVRRLIGSRA